MKFVGLPDRWRPPRQVDEIGVPTNAAPARDASSERIDDRRPASEGGAGLLLSVACLGVLIVAIAFAGGRSTESWATPCFWIGLLVIYLPIGYRLLDAQAGSSERLCLVVILGMGLYVVKVMQSPAGFTFHDELGQMRSTNDVLATGQLFHSNPIVHAYSYFPGLHLVTSSVVALSGLSVFASGVLIIGMARLILVVALFGFVRRVANSSRVAGIAVLVYAANPNFVFFDAQYSYETLAISLAAATLLVTALQHARSSSSTGIVVSAGVLAAGTALTHHLTSYALSAALLVWAIVAASGRRGKPRNWSIAWIASISILASVGWWLLAGHEAGQELGQVLGNAATGLWNVVTGSGASKAPFSAAPGYQNPILEKLVGLASVGLTLLVLPLGLIAIFRARTRHAALPMLGLAAAAYPIALAVRLTAAGTETSNRTSEFIFLGLGTGIAFVVARLISKSVRAPEAVNVQRLYLAALTVAVGIVFVGGITVGWAPESRVPGNYEVEAEMRSIDPEAVAAAKWAGEWLPPHSRILTNRSNKGLMAAYGAQNPLGGYVLHRPVGEIFSLPTLTPWQKAMIRKGNIDYLVVDSRLDESPPRSGRYFDREAGVFEPRLHGADLRKFGNVSALSRIYSGGSINIYDTRRLLHGP